MTPKQLLETPTLDLVKLYKSKARCRHAEYQAGQVWKELEVRLGKHNFNLRKIIVGHAHILLGEGDAEFNEACDNLIKWLDD